MINFVLGLWVAWILVLLVIWILKLFSKKENPFDQLGYLTLVWLEERTRDHDIMQWQGFCGKVHFEIKKALTRKENNLKLKKKHE